jgi:hypothetical protein
MSEQLFASQNLTAGQLNAIVKKLGGEEGALEFLRGNSEVVKIKHVIDLDANPLIPYNGWEVNSHKKGGKFVWNPTKVHLFLSERQKEGESVEGNKLMIELEKHQVFNANLLDYLLEHPNLIPEEWKVNSEGQTNYIFFWGTIYRDSDGDLCVRSLCFDGGHWQASYHWLDGGFGDQRRSPG